MERSSYLEWMNKETLSTAYESGEEAFSEEMLSLNVLMQLYEQKKSCAISPDFAKRDWALTCLHLNSRRQALGDKRGFMGIRGISLKLSLNSLEELMLLMAAASRAGSLEAEAVSRMRGDRKKETVSQEAAECLYGFLCELEERKREEARPERTALFLKNWDARAGAGQESSMLLRPRVLDELYKAGSLPALRGVLSKFCRRRETTASLPKVFIYEELLTRMKRMCRNETGGPDWNLGLLGERGSGKELLACHLAGSLGRPLLAVDGRALAGMKRDPALAVRTPALSDWEQELLCECLLSGDLLYFKNPEEEDFLALRNGLSGLVVVGLEPIPEQEGEESWRQLKSRCVCLELASPTAEQKARLWSEFLKEYPHSPELEPSALGSKYVLNAGGIKKALYAACKWAEGRGGCQIGKEELSWAVHQSETGQLGAFASLVPSVFGWEDLIVEDKVRQQLSYICGQLKYRSIVGNQWGFFEKMPYGKGLCALFYGPPGTGKTMAVQVIARELGLDLYRVDLSRMVSKYIGETEKNISSLFEKASHMNVILFFDEADSFFSKRSEVKDANDRNANAEVAHLLQKIEEYEGVTILATNLKENIDDAFKRRIKFMVNFRFPSVETRKTLWKSLLPPKAPREESLDMDFFAEHFELSGSQIKEILLNAAYIAAGEGRPIGNEQVKEALCLNYEKYGKFLTKEDFGYLG